MAACALYAALAFVYLLPAMSGGRVLLPWGLAARFEPWASENPDVKPEPWDPLVYDGIGQFYPWRAYGFGQMRQGRIALWNPYQMCGQPFLANGQSALLYPGNAPFWFMPTAKAFAVTAWLHLALAGLFTFGLLRRLGASTGASVAAGIVFAFSNWQAAWLHLPTFLCTSAWMPAAMWASVSLMRDRSRSAWLGLAVALTMALLAGHLQVAVYVAIAAAAAALYAAWGMAKRRAIGRLGLAATALAWPRWSLRPRCRPRWTSRAGLTDQAGPPRQATPHTPPMPLRRPGSWASSRRAMQERPPTWSDHT